MCDPAVSPVVQSALIPAAFPTPPHSGSHQCGPCRHEHLFGAGCAGSSQLRPCDKICDQRAACGAGHASRTGGKAFSGPGEAARRMSRKRRSDVFLQDPLRKRTPAAPIQGSAMR
eukprot:evm.model.scf_1037.7 EVM.evm.TU.scf_1037.7   scf_1037:40851-42452(+)